MNKNMILDMLGMTENQIIEVASKYNLNDKEIEVFNKGKEFIDKIQEINNNESNKRIFLCLIAYGLMKEKEVK